ncbi:hypothetical protein PHSY_001064 [Pseudozyma hubeiensis SY62]|uniref:Uncharacterized protein n=1 Tax=Pseudozyma hubeiensis (strain SY62) TaxID=1305764 RepID=R9NXW7_PSEHS|nr:hypothetical protein PHSY_001064 [Pseudozyma hubeiensis SY62]GAC93499.1 hypothetical protein PHSY_001064 [Pseudozyma hubeiensis SY62]
MAAALQAAGSKSKNCAHSAFSCLVLENRHEFRKVLLTETKLRQRCYVFGLIQIECGSPPMRCSLRSCRYSFAA